jgi:RNA polymerase sigma factor (sigma-70 family)
MGETQGVGATGTTATAERTELEDVYREHGKRLWWALLAYSGDREIASDAVAETFARALGAKRPIRSPADWIWRVAFRLAAKEMKRRARQDVAVEESYEMDERTHDLMTALHQLSTRQRGAIVLHYYAGYSTREIASLTESTAATVAVHLHRGRKKLRELLEEFDG